MKEFQLYAIHKNHQYLLTDHTLGRIDYTHNATYDEQLSEADNDQFTLTFSMARIWQTQTDMQPAQEKRGSVNSSEIPTLITNPWLNIVKMGSKLRLVIDHLKTIDFIVSAVTPTPTKNNVTYQFTAQDMLSYLWSRHNVGYTFPQEEDEEGAHNIFFFLNRILAHNHVNNIWWVTRTSLTAEMERKLESQIFSFSVDGSNLYNAIVEACNVMDYRFYVDYARNAIMVYIPDKTRFSGYRYRPETNQKSFSASYDAAELCTIMHAVGGTDAQDQNIPLVPALPYPFRIYLNEQQSSWTTVGASLAQDRVSFVDNYYSDMLNKFCEADGVEKEDGVVVHSDKNKELNHFISEETLQEEYEECEVFASIADKVPYLGQFLFDFSFFDADHTNLMTDNDTKQLYSILDQMRIENTWLKIYTPDYYSSLYQIAQKHGRLEALAEQYEAECLRIANLAETSTEINQSTITSNWDTLTKIQDDITKELDAKYFGYFNTAYGNQSGYYRTMKDAPNCYDFSRGGTAEKSLSKIKLYPEWIEWAKKINNAEEQYDYYTTRLAAVDAKLKNSNLSENNAQYLALESEAAKCKQQMDLYKTLKSSWVIGEDSDYAITVPGKWSLLLGLITKQLEGWEPNSEGVAVKIAQHEGINSNLTTLLYMTLDQFIYESFYENTDELDSVGLYNQTVNNFALYNKPNASYNLTTIDLSCLKRISTPDVAVGSRVKVYNEWLNLDDDTRNNLQFTSNDLLITGISRKLRSNDDIQLTVEKTNKTNTLLQKLIMNIKEK